MTPTHPESELVALLELSERAIQGEWTIGKIESDGARIDCGEWEQIAYLWQTTRRYLPGDNLDATGPEFGVENPQANAEFICALVNWFRSTRAATVPQGVSDAWISVKDRTPDEDVPVWCSINGSEPWHGAYCFADGDEEDGAGWAWMRCDSRPYFINGKWKCDDIEWDDQYDVTHWQPLPTPPPAELGRGRDGR